MARPATIDALLDLLPSEGEQFHPAARELWTKAFSALLDITYGAAPAAAPTAPQTAPTAAQTATSPVDSPITCPDCGAVSKTAGGYRQHRYRNHPTGDAVHVSGPPPKPAPTAQDNARQRAAEAMYL